MVTRIKTHVEGLDQLIQGGLPKGSINLISGTPGTGKTILASQIAFYQALSGKKCLYLNLEQREGQIETQMKQFGWDANKVKNNLTIVTVDTSDLDIVKYVLKHLSQAKYDLIILDSLDSISSSPISSEDLKEKSLEKIEEFTIPVRMDSDLIGRLKLKKIFSAIMKTKATALLTSEKVEGGEGLSRDTVSEFLCDGIILLMDTGIAGNRAINISVKKMRLTKITRGFFPLQTDKKGMRIIEEEGHDLLMK